MVKSIKFAGLVIVSLGMAAAAGLTIVAIAAHNPIAAVFFGVTCVSLNSIGKSIAETI